MDQGNHNRRKQISEPIKTHNKQSSKKCYLHWSDWTRNCSPQQTTFRSRSSATKTIPLEPSKLSYQLTENRHHKILVKFFNNTFSELTKSLGRSSSCEISISTSTLATKEPNRHRVNKSILELVRSKCFSSVFFFFFFFLRESQGIRYPRDAFSRSPKKGTFSSVSKKSWKVKFKIQP